MDDPKKALCTICKGRRVESLLDLSGDPAVTSLGEIIDDDVVVKICRDCGHATKDPLKDSEAFYSNEYTISTSSDDDDQIYAVAEDGVATYRTQHQATLILRSTELRSGARVLDYGCAKGLTSRWLLSERPDLELFLYDVTDIHRDRWASLVHPSRTASHKLPNEWLGSFDLVFTMFTLEHMVDPGLELSMISDLLRPRGSVHGVVPYLVYNWADLIVRDHINHFSVTSMERILDRANFGSVRIDTTSHDAALTFTAERGGAKSDPARPTLPSTPLDEIADYWRQRRAKIARFEETVAGRNSAIFGAGVNGAFIFNSISDRSRVRCFLDNSPHLRGTSRLGMPVIGPSELPDDVEVVYVALSPRVADQAIAASLLGHRDLVFFR